MEKGLMEEVVCVRPECGKRDRYPVGYLTELAKKDYLCATCREIVLERRVREKQIGNRRLLTED